MSDKLWAIPPQIKILEAWGCLGDKRITITDNTAKAYSSSGNKYYEVSYDPESNAIASNDNGSYWQGYLGYPAISFLMHKNVLPLNEKLVSALSGIHWKDINTKFKNDFNKTESYVRDILTKASFDNKYVDVEIEKVIKAIENLKIAKLSSNAKPPSQY